MLILCKNKVIIAGNFIVFYFFLYICSLFAVQLTHCFYAKYSYYAHASKTVNALNRDAVSIKGIVGPLSSKAAQCYGLNANSACVCN